MRMKLERSAFNLNQLISGNRLNTEVSTAVRRVFDDANILE